MFSFSIRGGCPVEPNELKDMNNVLALPFNPFLCEILELNEAKFSLLLDSSEECEMPLLILCLFQYTLSPS